MECGTIDLCEYAKKCENNPASPFRIASKDFCMDAEGERIDSREC